MQKRRKIKQAKLPFGIVRDTRPLGLYIHTPFCRKKCDYCDFYSLECGRDFEKTANRYCKALADHFAETAATTVAKVDSVYFGGGTPTVLGAKRLTSLLGSVKKLFDLDKNAEITLEANPESTDLTLLKKLRKAGFNRVSFGIQSADDGELATLGRLHSFGEAKNAFRAARDAGFTNISVDLMFGIENQTRESWKSTLREIIALGPEHISAYALKIEDGTPLARRSAPIPDDDLQADMYLDACEILGKEGYTHYEISNWAKPQKESRHNLRYWRIEPYMGFGPAAASDCFGERWGTGRDLDAYIAGIESGGSVVSDFEKIPAEERAFEYIMLGLRTSDGISKVVLRRKYRLDPDSVRGTLEKLASEGLVATDDEKIVLTERGFLLSNSIIIELASAMKPLENPFALKKD